MNCTDCRAHAAAHLEHLLEPAVAAEFELHLATCPACREHVAASADLATRLAAHGARAGGVSVSPGVLARIHAERPPVAAARPVALFTRWWMGAGAAAAAAVVLLLSALLLAPRDSRAQAAGVMTRGINALTPLTTVHLQGRMRTLPHDNFSLILPAEKFCPIELWKELEGAKRWRIEKPGRIAWMDGQTTSLYLRSAREARRYPVTARSAFDTDWLHAVANLEETLASGLKMAQTHGWKMELTPATDASGARLQLVTIDVPAGVPAGDYLHNKYLPTAATRRLHRFNDQTGQLEALQIYLRDQGDYLLVFEVTHIDYNQPFAPDVFAVALPADVTIADLPRPDAPRNAAAGPAPAAGSAPQAARAFFDACVRQDWVEVQAFIRTPLNDRRKASFGSISAVVQIGETFTSAGSDTQFVPYEILLRNGATKKHNLALKQDPRTGRWYFDGGF